MAGLCASIGDFSLDSFDGQTKDDVLAVYFCGLPVRVSKPQIQLFFVVE